MNGIVVIGNPSGGAVTIAGAGSAAVAGPMTGPQGPPGSTIAGVESVNGRIGQVTLAASDIRNVAPARLLGRRSGGGVGDAEPITTGKGIKIDSTGQLTITETVAETFRAINAGIGLTGGGDLAADRTLSVDFAASKEVSATKVVRSDDERLETWSNAAPTLASNLSGIPSGTVLPTGETAIDILNRLLYPYQGVSFASLAAPSIPTPLELGQVVSGPALLSWTTSGPSANWTANSASLSYTAPSGSGTLATGLSPTGNGAAVTLPSLTGTNPRGNNTLTVTLSGSQAQGGNPSASITRRWWSRIYHGKSSNPDLLSPTFDVPGTATPMFLETSDAQGPANLSLTVPAGGGWFYLFVHDAYALSTAAPYLGLKYGGNALAQDPVVTVQLTNAQGHVATYKRYKARNVLNDAIVIVVNPTS